MACRYGHVETVKTLLSWPRVSTDTANEQGWTALHEACNVNQIEVVRVLVEFGKVDITARSTNGKLAKELTLEPSIKRILEKAESDPEYETGGQNVRSAALFQREQLVQLHSLTKKAYNGRKGKILTYLPSQDRFSVKLIPKNS